MNYVHNELAKGRWGTLSLAEQMGNIGSEISRAQNWKSKNEQIFINTIYRALELLDLTIADRRWGKGLKEIARSREILTETIFGENKFETSLEDLDHYFTQFALYLRKSK